MTAGIQRRQRSRPVLPVAISAVVLCLLVLGILAGLSYNGASTSFEPSSGMAPRSAAIEAGLGSRPAVNPSTSGHEIAALAAAQGGVTIPSARPHRIVRHPLTLAAPAATHPPLYRRPPPRFS